MTKDIYALVGERIREERRRAGLTIEQLAERAGISPSFLAYIETKGRKASLETIRKLAEALRLPIADVFKTAARTKRDAADDAAQRFVHLVRDRSDDETLAILGVVRATVEAVRTRRRE